jgi:NAD(P)H-dependent FMN reductase
MGGSVCITEPPLERKRMNTLQIVAVSTREGRQGIYVAEWFKEIATQYGKFAVEFIDLKEINLPMFDEPKHPRLKQYAHDHTKQWSALVERADAFVFVTPEYNFSAPPSLVNALDYLNREWFYKAAGFVSYGGVSGGTRGVQVSKGLLTALKVMPIPETVAIPFFAQFINAETKQFDPGDTQVQAAKVMLDELLRWTDAIKGLRDKP